MGRTKQKGILKGDQRLWSLHITDKTSKDEVKKQAIYPKGDKHYSSRNIETIQLENAKYLKLKILQTRAEVLNLTTCDIDLNKGQICNNKETTTKQQQQIIYFVWF
jgi:hypothetical protein